MIVVCNLMQYPKFNGVIDKTTGRITRSDVVIPKSLMDNYNAEYEDTEYIIDEAKTAEYNKPKEVEPTKEVKK